MFQETKQGIVHYSCKNTFGDMAKIEFAYFIILEFKQKNTKVRK